MSKKFNVFHDELEAEDERYYRPGYAKRNVRVGDAIGGDLIGGTIYELEEGERVCPYHYHHGVEEWLYVIAGELTLRQPDGERALRPGDVVSFPWGPEGAHTVTGPGRVLMLSANRWPSISVYPDSDKIGARPEDWGTHDEDRLNFRRETAVEYWDREE
jgi:uncharacterized cupin superfamily protein